MKEILLQQLQKYSESINSLQNELVNLESHIREKTVMLEQNKGAYSAILEIAMEQGIIDSSGNVIDSVSENNLIFEEEEELTEK